MRYSNSSLCTRTSCESILEDLLEAQELQNGEIDSWVESQTTLVWTKSRVELHAEAIVHLNLSLVVLPRHSELNDSLRNGGDLQSGLVLGMLVKE